MHGQLGIRILYRGVKELKKQEMGSRSAKQLVKTYYDILELKQNI